MGMFTRRPTLYRRLTSKHFLAKASELTGPSIEGSGDTGLDGGAVAAATAAAALGQLLRPLELVGVWNTAQRLTRGKALGNAAANLESGAGSLYIHTKESR